MMVATTPEKPPTPTHNKSGGNIWTPETGTKSAQNKEST